MSMPNIPDIKPEISLDRCQTINLLLNSIALEEIALSHIMNAEGEKLQLFLKKNIGNSKGIWEINDSVNKTLRTIVKSQILLQFKLEDVMTLDRHSDCDKKCSKCHGHCNCKGCKGIGKCECCIKHNKCKCVHHDE